MKFYLNDSGLFYSCGSLIKLSKKPVGVSRYIIYDSIEPLKIVETKKKVYNMKNRQILEVQTEKLERFFFFYEDGFFAPLKVKPIDILEGEDELLKHFGLLGLRRAEHYDEDSLI